MIIIRHILSSLLIIIFLISCASHGESTIFEEEKRYINKPDLKFSLKYLPKKINIFYFDSKPENFIEGLMFNYFYYKNYINYSPELIFIDLRNKKDLCTEIKVSRSSYSIVYYKDNNISDLNSFCLSKIKINNGIVLNMTNKEPPIPKGFSYLNIKRHKAIQDIMLYAKNRGAFSSIIIDDIKTKDGNVLERFWNNLGGEVVSMANFSKKTESQILLSELLFLQQSITRSRKLSRKISLPLAHIPRSRKDLDSFIISTSLESSRSLNPAFEYNFTNLLPVYLIPSWNDEELISAKELDLEGVFIIDSPFMLRAKVHPLSQTNFKRSRGFAAGYDIFELLLMLNTQNKIDYQGMLGLISKDSNGLKFSSLIAEIRKGKLEYIGFID